jgi:DNA-directed RNA polymerase specialized sigma24 family protein
MSAERLLRRLPQRQREVFTLNLIGLRQVHIAGLLGIDSGDARANLC